MYFLKNLIFFAHKKLKKKHLKKLHNYSVWEFFFSTAPTAQNSPELHFCFINSFIQSSLVGSLRQVVLMLLYVHNVCTLYMCALSTAQHYNQ